MCVCVRVCRVESASAAAATGRQHIVGGGVIDRDRERETTTETETDTATATETDRDRDRDRDRD